MQLTKEEFTAKLDEIDLMRPKQVEPTTDQKIDFIYSRLKNESTLLWAIGTFIYDHPGKLDKCNRVGATDEFMTKIGIPKSDTSEYIEATFIVAVLDEHFNQELAKQNERKATI